MEVWSLWTITNVNKIEHFKVAIVVRQRACRRVILSFVLEFLTENVDKTC